jgi:hypothetical protein
LAGHLVVPGIFDGEHVHEIEALTPQRTRYVQREEFRGVLVPFVRGMLKDTERGFHEMNAALKVRAERERDQRLHQGEVEGSEAEASATEEPSPGW